MGSSEEKGAKNGMREFGHHRLRREHELHRKRDEQEQIDCRRNHIESVPNRNWKKVEISSQPPHPS
jgi:hypothetical protein